MTVNDPDVLERRAGGGCLMLIGLPFLLTGLFTLAVSVGLGPESWHRGDAPEWYFGIPFGLVFAIVGGALVFGRSGVIIHRREQTIVKWWGLLGPMKRTVYALEAVNGVVLTKEVQRSGDSSHTVYPVRLQGPERPVDIWAPGDYQDARREAEKLAKFIGCPLIDHTTGTAVVRQAEEVDESLRDRARRLKEHTELPPMPARMQSKCDIGGESITIIVPSRGGVARAALVLPVALIIPAIAFFAFFLPILGERGTPWGAKLVFLGFAGLFVVGPLLAGLVAASGGGSTEIAASPEELRVRRRRSVFGRSTRIPAAELEELILPARHDAQATIPSQTPAMVKAVLSMLSRQPGIIARSDRVTIEFGAGLPYEELVWLRAVILRMMTI